MGVQSELKTSFAPAFSKHPGSKSLQIVDIMLAAISIWLVVKYFDAQVGYSEVAEALLLVLSQCYNFRVCS